jgi:ubiquinone biosynthesis monooxygenase Coq7
MLHIRGLGVRLASTSAATSASRKLLDSIIRVDHAGELGADRIYAGQMAVLGIVAQNNEIESSKS